MEVWHAFELPEFTSLESFGDGGHTLDVSGIFHQTEASLLTKFSQGSAIVKFVVGEGEHHKVFLADKDVICQCSPVFERAFKGHFLESESQVMVLEDVNPDIFELFLRSATVQFIKPPKSMETDDVCEFDFWRLDTDLIDPINSFIWERQEINRLVSELPKHSTGQCSLREPKERCDCFRATKASEYLRDTFVEMMSHRSELSTGLSANTRSRVWLGESKSRRPDPEICFHKRTFEKDHIVEEGPLPVRLLIPRNNIIEMANLWILADRFLMKEVKEEILSHVRTYARSRSISAAAITASNS